MLGLTTVSHLRVIQVKNKHRSRQDHRCRPSLCQSSRLQPLHLDVLDNGYEMTS